MGKNIIGIIGGGNMGEAFIKGLLAKKLSLPTEISVSEADNKRARQLKEKYHVRIESLDVLMGSSSTVILAVKPQDMENVLSAIKEHHPLFISIAAGLTLKYFEKHLGRKARVVRAMPNMPALIGEGITAICKGPYTSPIDMRQANRLLGAVGRVVEVSEKYMDAVTAVSGSGPAYVFLFVESWIKAAQALGLNNSQAQDLVYETLVGSAHLLKQSTLKAGELRAKVTSKGGTTQAALDVFFKAKFDLTIKSALSSAKKRAKELAK